MRSIESYMDDNRLFLKSGYTINDFSKEIHIPVYLISKCLNTFKGLGFLDYINQKRVYYSVKKFDDGEWPNYKIEAIATECGFNNRNSFTNAFKKFLGTSPSEYRENFHKSQSSIISLRPRSGNKSADFFYIPSRQYSPFLIECMPAPLALQDALTYF